MDLPVSSTVTKFHLIANGWKDIGQLHLGLTRMEKEWFERLVFDALLGPWKK